MQKKVVKGTTENLNILNNKIEYIGFKLGEVPSFLKTFEPLNYKVPKVYDETTYKIYKYINIEDIEILITPCNRLDDLGEKYKYASPLFTYMKPEKNEDIEKYAQFLKMINQTRLEDIEEMEEEQNKMTKEPPFEVKFPGNFKWQIYYSDYAKKYFMLASTEESDNSQLFYLLKKKIEEHKSRRKTKGQIFVPISNENYTEKVLKIAEIADLENYIWFFTKNWPSIYEITDQEGKVSLQIVGETNIYDKIVSKYNLKFTDKKEAMKEYKLIKALFILAYDIQNEEYKFETRIDKNGHLVFYFDKQLITYDSLPKFLNEQAIAKSNENIKIKLNTKELQADIKDYQKHSEYLNAQYLKKEKQIYTFLECRKSFFGKVKYFFKNKESKDEGFEEKIQQNKNRMKDILSQDKHDTKLYNNSEEDNKTYTVEDIIKICKELNENLKEYRNLKLDIKALKNKIDSLEKKIKNADQYIKEIEKHRKSIFEFWKFANKNETRFLSEGSEDETNNADKLKKTFNYEDDIETFASKMDEKQRKQLSEEEKNATFAASFVLDGINTLSKDKILKEDEEKIQKILNSLKIEYQNNIEKIEEKDFDIFGNVSEDKTKIKTLNNISHRENEKDKFKILNVNLDTQLDAFMEKLVEIKNILEKESNKIEIPYNISVYKASTEKLDTDGFDKFDLNPQKSLETLEKSTDKKEIYLYKINIPEKTKLIFYSNIIFYENNNETLPLGMDISQETLINMDLYSLELKNKDEFNVNIEDKKEMNNCLKNVKVYEYDLKEKPIIDKKSNAEEEKK